MPAEEFIPSTTLVGKKKGEALWQQHALIAVEITIRAIIFHIALRDVLVRMGKIPIN